jgi:DNA end-binding protein Ku
MAAPRSTWKGYLKSLVSCPVKLFNAVSESEKIRLHQLSKKTQNRVKQKLFDAVADTEVPREDIVKGYEVGEDRYVVITDADFENLQTESTKTVELTRFVDAAQIDPVYYDKPYYMAPDGRVAQEPFRVITEALRRQAKVGLGHVVPAQKERLVALRPIDKGLVLSTLRSADEVRPISKTSRRARSTTR